MPSFEQYYFTFDNKQRVVASSNPANNSTIENLCMASSFDPNTYAKSRQLSFDSFNDRFLILETHRLKNSSEGRAVRFIHAYELAGTEGLHDPRCYMAPCSFEDGEDGTYKNTPNLPQCSFERIDMSAKEIALSLLSPEGDASLDTVRRQLGRLIAIVYKYAVFGVDNLLFHLPEKDDKSLCEAGSLFALLLHLVTPPSRRKFLSADTNILGNINLSKRLNFTNSTAAFKNAGMIIELKNGVLSTAENTPAFIEKVCAMLADKIAVAVLNSDEQLSSLLDSFDNWLVSANTSVRSAFENMSIYAVLGSGRISPAQCDMTLSKFCDCIEPKLWQDSKAEFKTIVQALLTADLLSGDASVQTGSFNKVLSLAKTAGEYIDCKGGEYYEIFALSMAQLHKADENAAAAVAKNIRNLHGGINSAASKLIAKENDEEMRELLYAVRSDLIELPEKFDDILHMTQFISNFPQLLQTTGTTRGFIEKAAVLYGESNDSVSVAAVFRNRETEPMFTKEILKGLDNQPITAVSSKAEKYIEELTLSEENRIYIAEKLKAALLHESATDPTIYTALTVASKIGKAELLHETTRDIYRSKTENTKNLQELYDLVEYPISNIADAFSFNFTDMVSDRAVSFCNEAFASKDKYAPALWAQAICDSYKCLKPLTKKMVQDFTSKIFPAFEYARDEYIRLRCDNIVPSKSQKLAESLRLESWRCLIDCYRQAGFPLDTSYEKKSNELFKSLSDKCDSLNRINSLAPSSEYELMLSERKIYDILNAKFSKVSSMADFNTRKAQCEKEMTDISTPLQEYVKCYLVKFEDAYRSSTASNIGEKLYHILNLERSASQVCSLLKKLVTQYGPVAVTSYLSQDANSRYKFTSLYLNSPQMMNAAAVSAIFPMGSETGVYDLIAFDWLHEFKIASGNYNRDYKAQRTIHLASLIKGPAHPFTTELKHRAAGFSFLDAVCCDRLEDMAHYVNILFIADENSCADYCGRILNLINDRNAPVYEGVISLYFGLLSKFTILRDYFSERGSKALSAMCAKIYKSTLGRCKTIILENCNEDNCREYLKLIGTFEFDKAAVAALNKYVTAAQKNSAKNK